MTDHSMMKLGLIRSAPNMSVPALGDVWTGAPMLGDAMLGAVEWYDRLPSDWGMMGNDEVGDCTCAAIGHVIEQWTAYTDPAPVVMTTEQVIAAYSAISGYVPGEPQTDVGATCVSALKYWMRTGMNTPGGGPDTLTAFARVRSVEELRRAIATFGNAYAGVALPISAQSEDVWSSTADAPGSWGGHCVPLVGFNGTGPICVTWGALKQMTWAWWEKYGEEAYAMLSPDWMRANGFDPAGVNWGTLKEALATI